MNWYETGAGQILIAAGAIAIIIIALGIALNLFLEHWR